jgi:hypothetical protein
MNMNTSVTTAPGWVLIKEALEGIKAVQVYATREEAMDAFKQVTKKLKTTNCKSSYKACEAAVMDKDQTVYIVQQTSDAVKLDDKMVWSVNQSIFFNPGDVPAKYEWRHQFATKEEAVKLYNKQLELYKEQAARNPEIEINYTKSGLGALICKNGVPVVDLFCESSLIGQYSKVGVIVLDSVYEGK